MPVEPEVNRYLPTESGPSQSIAVSTSDVAGVPARLVYDSESSPPSVEITDTPVRSSAASALRNGSIDCTKIAFGFTAAKQCFSFAKSVDMIE